MLAAYGLAWLPTLSASGPSPSDSRRLRLLLAWFSAALAGLVLAVVGLHAAVLAWPSGALDAIRAAYLALPRDSYPLTPANVLNGLVWSTDLANPRVSGALAGLALSLAILWLWQRPGQAHQAAKTWLASAPGRPGRRRSPRLRLGHPSARAAVRARSRATRRPGPGAAAGAGRHPESRARRRSPEPTVGRPARTLRRSGGERLQLAAVRLAPRLSQPRAVRRRRFARPVERPVRAGPGALRRSAQFTKG